MRIITLIGFLTTLCNVRVAEAQTQKLGCKPLTLRVEAIYSEQSVTSASRSSKVITASSASKSSMNSLSTSAEVSAGYGAFSGSAAASYASVKEDAASSSESRHEESSEKTDFNPDFLQIIQQITRSVTVDGNTATTVTTEFVDSVPLADEKSYSELKQLAETYIADNYGDLDDGHVTKNKYELETCIKVQTKDARLKFYEDKNGNGDEKGNMIMKATTVGRNDLDTYGFQNDKSKSIKICYAPEGTWVKVYDDGGCNDSKGSNAKFTILKDLWDDCITIGDLDYGEYTAPWYVSMSRRKQGNGDLNHRISCFKMGGM